MESIRSAWTVHGQYTVSTRTVQGQYMESIRSAWTVQGQYIESTWTVHGKYAVHRQYMESTRTVHGKYAVINYRDLNNYVSPLSMLY